jgi:mRNA interferase MazF
MLQPSRGEVWVADLDPTRGHEQAGKRPVVVVSSNYFNHGAARLIFVAPLTRTDRGVPFHIAIDPPEGGLRDRSFALCDAVRSISIDWLSGRPLGRLKPATLAQIEDRLRLLLDL